MNETSTPSAIQLASDSLLSPTFLVSAMLIAMTAAMAVAVVFRGTVEQISSAQNTLQNVLIAVAAYWVGSSAGSAKKDEKQSASVVQVPVAPAQAQTVTVETKP